MTGCLIDLNDYLVGAASIARLPRCWVIELFRYRNKLFTYVDKHTESMRKHSLVQSRLLSRLRYDPTANVENRKLLFLWLTCQVAKHIALANCQQSALFLITIQIFYAQSNKSETGALVRKSLPSWYWYQYINSIAVGIMSFLDERNLIGLQQAVLKHVESQPKPLPSWPLLSPVRRSDFGNRFSNVVMQYKDISSVQTVKQWMLSHADQRVFLVLEEDSSFLGREVRTALKFRIRCDCFWRVPVLVL